MLDTAHLEQDVSRAGGAQLPEQRHQADQAVVQDGLRHCPDLGLLDETSIDLAPVLLGSGVPDVEQLGGGADPARWSDAGRSWPPSRRIRSAVP